LEAAGIPYIVDGPEGPLYCDFHSLRHSYVALLDRAGVTVKEAMHLARHSDPKLTMKRYGKPRRHDLTAAMNRFPQVLRERPSGESQALSATGTDPLPYTTLTQSSDSRSHSVRADDNRAGASETVESSRKSLRIKTLENNSNPLSTDEENGPRRIRTSNQGIMSPLLCR
jgi:hypothetical protein